MLEWSKVDFRNGWIVADDQLQRERGKGLQPQGKTKNRKVRFVEMNAELRSYLEDLCKENPRDRWVLQNTCGGPISPEDLNDAFSDLAWLAGLIHNRGEHGQPLADPSLHDMRHTFATRLARNGVPIHVVADLLGDTIEVCSRYYTHSDHGQRRQAVELLCQN